MPGLWPAPDAIRQISVTAAVDLLQCGLRAAFKADRTPDVLPVSPRSTAVLGTLAHELAEDVARGEFDATADEDLGVALESWWEQRAHQEWERLQKVRWLGVIPPPPRWRHYQRVRIRAMALARSQAMRRRSIAQTHVAVTVEREFATDFPPLRGRVDKIERAGDDLRIVDLKSAEPGESIKPQHRVQLLLYAALLRASGMRPTEAAIEYVDGSRHSFPVSWEEVDALVASVLAARDRVNAAAQQQDATRSLADLAMASKDNCRFCPFRICCQPFQEERRRDPEMDHAFLAGEVIATEESAIGRTLVIQSEFPGPDDPLRRRLIGIPREVDAQRGDLVTVSDAAPSVNDTDVRATWETSLVVWTPAGTIRGAFPRPSQPAMREIGASLEAASDDALGIPV